MAVGLVDRHFPLIRYQPGWRRGSYAWHSDDGKKFGGYTTGFPVNYGPKFGAGDTIGCGWDQLKREIFFTHNGKPLQVAFTHVSEEHLFPAVGIDSHEIVQFNFGQRPFQYQFAEPPAPLPETHPIFSFFGFSFHNGDDMDDDDDDDEVDEDDVDDEEMDDFGDFDPADAFGIIPFPPVELLSSDSDESYFSSDSQSD